MQRTRRKVWERERGGRLAADKTVIFGVGQLEWKMTGPQVKVGGDWGCEEPSDTVAATVFAALSVMGKVTS